MNDYMICLQARTSSNRLPAKSLLYLSNYPLFVLAAKRAQSTGLETLVLTSTCPDDDLLVKCAEQNNLKVFRGSLENTLERFVLALENENQNKIIVRLTADNYFPDGFLIQEMIEFFEKSNCEYLTTNDVSSGLPHGCSVEVFRYKVLCEALNSTVDPYDLEHVTPWVMRNKLVSVFEKYSYLNLDNRSTTIDTYSDFCLAMNILKNESDPDKVSFINLIQNAQKIWEKENFLPLNAKLIIGGAQLGLNYGYHGKKEYNAKAAQRLIELALKQGCRKFDTAQGYGDSEANIGAVQQRDQNVTIFVQNKLSCLNNLPNSYQLDSVRSEIRHSVHHSIVKLNKNSLDTMLLHRWSHWHNWGGVVRDEIISLKVSGLIKKIGASIQNEVELVAALQDDQIDSIQMPFNILDHRWAHLVPQIIKTKKQRKLEITVRSVFLQGLILSNSNKFWKTVAPDDYQNIINWLHALTLNLSDDNIKRIALKYVRSHKWIDGIIVGVETGEQLNEVIAIFAEDPLSIEELKYIFNSRMKLSENILNPALWRL